MSKAILKVAAAALILATASCEKEIMVKTPPYAPGLVVNGTIGVGDYPTLYISKSVGITDYNQNKKLWVDNARVLLYREGNIVDSLSFESMSGAYQGHAILEAGSAYKISVTAPGFSPVSATELAPVLVPLKNLARIKAARLSGDGETQDEIKISFDDPALPGDYYILSLNMFDANGDTTVELGCVNTTDASVESIYDEQIDNTTCLDGREIFFRDELFNGTTREMRFFVNSKYLERISSGGVFTISLSHVSESYFKYRKSFLYASENKENPFSEPVRVHSNINGGHGIFAIINADSKAIN